MFQRRNIPQYFQIHIALKTSIVPTFPNASWPPNFSLPPKQLITCRSTNASKESSEPIFPVLTTSLRSNLSPDLAPQVSSGPNVPLKAPSKEQSEHFWHIEKKRHELEAYFRFSKFSTHRQHAELGQKIDLMEYQIQVSPLSCLAFSQSD